MALHRTVAAVGSAATTFLVVGAAVVEAVTAAVGGDVGPGIVGVAAGALAAIAAFLAVRWRWAASRRRPGGPPSATGRSASPCCSSRS